MRKNHQISLWVVSLVLTVVAFACVIYRSVQTKEGGTDKQAHTLKFPKDSENMDTGGNSKFFIRYIDTITLDTMYFVCRIDIHGDTIPDQIEVRYANDSICSYQYYLNNNGDTVLLDYSRQQDQIAQQDTLVWENDSLFNEVQDSILNADEQRLIEDVTEYLDRIAQKGLEKERTIDSLRRETVNRKNCANFLGTLKYRIYHNENYILNQNRNVYDYQKHYQKRQKGMGDSLKNSFCHHVYSLLEQLQRF